LSNAKNEKEMELNVDLIANGQAYGDVAHAMQNNGKLDLGRMRPFMAQDKNGNWGAYMTVYRGGNPKVATSWNTVPINTNAGTLRRDEWKALDEAIMEVSRQRLGGWDDVISRGLTYNLNNALGTTVLEWHDVSEGQEAVMTMDGVTRGKNDRIVYQHNYLPIPIIHVDYEINARALATSRNMGNGLDTTMAERAARRIMEWKEDLLFTDTTYAYGETDSRSRNKIYSYVNFPDRNQVALSAHWDDMDFDSDGATGGDRILEDISKMKAASIAAYHYGPWMLYIPTAYETLLDKDYNRTTPGTTIRERIMKLNGITGIKIVDRLTANNVLLVQMTSDVIRIVRGMGLTNVEWQTEGNMITKYKVMTIEVPQIRSDQNGKCGIVHATL
jgi:hypothetical protein